MTDQSNIFSEEPVTNEEKKEETNTNKSSLTSSQASSPEDDVLSVLSSIKNERGEQKYTDLPKALEGLRNAQEYIPQLKSTLAQREAELEQLREQLAKNTAVEDVVSKLTASQTEQNTTVSGLDEEKAVALFEQLLNQKEASKQASMNKQSVNDELVSRFGSLESAKKAFETKAEELGTSVADLGKLTESNPRMVLALFTTGGQQSKVAPAQSSVNTTALASQIKPEQGLNRPEKSLLSGATYREQLEYMKQVQQDVLKKYGINS